MGGSKSGKNALLNVLAGRIKTSSLQSGSVKFDGQSINDKVPSFMRCGFVEEHDYFFRDVTVKEWLTYR